MNSHTAYAYKPSRINSEQTWGLRSTSTVRIEYCRFQTVASSLHTLSTPAYKSLAQLKAANHDAEISHINFTTEEAQQDTEMLDSPLLAWTIPRTISTLRGHSRPISPMIHQHNSPQEIRDAMKAKGIPQFDPRKSPVQSLMLSCCHATSLPSLPLLSQPLSSIFFPLQPLYL